MQEKSQQLPLVLAVVATVASIVLMLYLGEKMFAPDVYTPTPPDVYAARMRQMDAHYADRHGR